MEDKPYRIHKHVLLSFENKKYISFKKFSAEFCLGPLSYSLCFENEDVTYVSVALLPPAQFLWFPRVFWDASTLCLHSSLTLVCSVQRVHLHSSEATRSTFKSATSSRLRCIFSFAPYTSKKWLLLLWAFLVIFSSFGSSISYMNDYFFWV